jgi:hypothetical protein
VRGKDLPEKLCPLKKYIADVKHLKNPNPVSVAKMKVFHDASSLRIADVASIKIREYVEQAHDGQHLLVELERW